MFPFPVEGLHGAISGRVCFDCAFARRPVAFRYPMKDLIGQVMKGTDVLHSNSTPTYSSRVLHPPVIYHHITDDLTVGTDGE